ncbi:NEVERSHED, ARF-GAP domain 5 [Hibiscus trionum]|uniref:NEVERSHED, ARF-GAP domain 5 n=1 Tax=Hibiscus trionum TaxID=183268 RepID=A0A9W7M4A8_HIBTR|nr:NEVERSHED, ARF-GAP domain 5 [Hibiscus trionum]
MNEKAHVSKELNEKHRKILEGLLKNPENRECADCKCKGPRWASVNLGVFICMQCSGIHRSLGVHISKVRSATLDTWLPEQVAFIQSMGNEKANSYWEAELPPNYNRVGTENFIRAKYEEKRWVPRNRRSKSPPRMLDERPPSYGKGPTEKSGHGHVNNSDNSFEERTIQASSRNGNLPATRISLPVPPKGLNPVAPVREPETVVVAPAEATTTTPTVTPPKFEYATDLFNMMSIDDAPSENASGSGAASTDDNDWAGFQSAGDTSAADKNDPPKAGEKNAQSATGFENLLNDSPPIPTNQVPEKPQKDVKNDIMSLFEKPNTVQPYSMHQQQLALLAHQQSLLMAAAAKSAPGNTPQSASNGAIIPTQQQLALLAQQQSLLMAAAGKAAPGNTQQPPSTTTSIPTQQQLALLAHQQSLLMAAAAKSDPGNTQQPPSTGTSIPTQAWPNIGYQTPGLMMPGGAQADLQKLMQTMQSGQTQQEGNNVASSSFHASGQVTPASGAATNGASKPQPASPISSTSSSHAGKDYDFSSLTQGMFKKR